MFYNVYCLIGFLSSLCSSALERPLQFNIPDNQNISNLKNVSSVSVHGYQKGMNLLRNINCKVNQLLQDLFQIGTVLTHLVQVFLFILMLSVLCILRRIVK